jgi:hypothetical protein
MEGINFHQADVEYLAFSDLCSSVRRAKWVPKTSITFYQRFRTSGMSISGILAPTHLTQMRTGKIRVKAYPYTINRTETDRYQCHV